jgi:hypothetical protein
MTTWQDYLRLARYLDDLTRDHEQATANTATQREADNAAVQQLDHRLAAQHQRLEHTGRILKRPLGQPPPTFTGITDPTQALHLARQHTDAADAATNEAELLAQQPALLPGVSPTARNLLIYGGCALVAVAAQYALLVASDISHLDAWTLLAWICTGFPAMAWIAGYVILSVWGRPRIGDPAVNRSPRLGFAICFLAMPAAFCAFKLVTSVLSP